MRRWLIAGRAAPQDNHEAFSRLHDIRAALGYARINLEGGSYDSELALAFERDYAPTVRGAVIESIIPPTQNAFGEQVLTYDRAVAALSAQCATDPCTGWLAHPSGTGTR